MRIVFAGSGTFGLPSLNALVDGGQEIALIVTQPDRPAGRGQTLQVGPVKWFARQRDIPIFQPEDINTRQSIRKIEAVKPDLLLVIAYGQKIGPDLLQLPPHKAVNLHASMLPRYRGAAPINWALINGEIETGLTVMAMTEQIDAGDILGQRSTTIEPDETASDLAERLSKLGARLVTEVVREIALDEVATRKQNDTQVTQAPRLKKADGRIEWEKTAQEIYNRIRGTTPWPGAFTHLAVAGKPPVRLVVERAALATLPAREDPGVVLAAGPDGIDVAAAKGSVRLLELTPAGKRKMSAADFVNGYRIKPGSKFIAGSDS
jgi:methionyl-tRNA formyltransferase